MRDGTPDQALAEPPAPTSRGLAYPCGEPPGPGEAKAVAPGVLWIRMPLPFALDHINVWALEDDGGWVIVDTGVATGAVRDLWRRLFDVTFSGTAVTSVICTHMHPDHVGMAGPLTEEFGCELQMTRLEYVTCRMLLADGGREAPEAGARFYRRAGWDEAQVAGYRKRFGSFGRGVAPLPDSYHRLEHGDRLRIGGETWRIVVGTGHSPEHACLLRERDGVLIAGDQLLPTISSNVSVWPTEPEADPLSDWLDSLRMLEREIPEDALVLPSHGLPFRGARTRLEALTRGHERSLQRLRRMLAEPKRAVDVFGALFARPIDDSLIGMATGESLAHLHCLRRRGLATCALDESGVAWWRAAEGKDA